jgi:hypothetical protein
VNLLGRRSALLGEIDELSRSLSSYIATICLVSDAPL